MKKQVMLIVLDGWGYREDAKDNAVLASKKPFFDELWGAYPHTLLNASGLAVGLPEGQMGNSEVGHTTIGAGTIINTDLVRINTEIANGIFGGNLTLKKLFDHVKKHNSTLHLQGLVSDGGVHSHQEHLFALLREAKKAGVKSVAIHVFTDGRDTSPTGGAEYLKKLENIIQETGIGHIATLSGRFYAMDRDKRWERIQKAEDAIFDGKGNVGVGYPSECLKRSYVVGVTDEYVEPIVFKDAEGRSVMVKSDDAIFFFNFRADRARELSERVVSRTKGQGVYFATMTNYGVEFSCDVAFPNVVIAHTLGSVIACAGLHQTHIAETEKFAHATYFLNGGREEPYANEDQILIPSRKDVKTYDLAPEMRAKEIADAAIGEIDKGQDFIFINFANPDMVGHTGNVPAIVRAIEETDTQCGRVVRHLVEKGGVAFITADHGNAEVNKDAEGNPHTAHTTNPVPAIVTKKGIALRENGGLSDVAPTIFELLDVAKPEEMWGYSLLTKQS